MVLATRSYADAGDARQLFSVGARWAYDCRRRVA